MKKILFSIIAASFMMTMNAQTKAPQLRADNIDEVIQAMTLSEKARILVGTGMPGITGCILLLGFDFLSSRNYFHSPYYFIQTSSFFA